MKRFAGFLMMALVAVQVLAGSEMRPPSRVKWISARESFREGIGKERYFRVSAEIAQNLKSAVAHWWIDDVGALYIDGKLISRQGACFDVDVTEQLRAAGRHTVAVLDKNLAGKGGVCLAIHLTYADGTRGCIHSSADWRCAKSAPDNWAAPEFDDSSWERAQAFEDLFATPWMGLRDMPHMLPADERVAYDGYLAARAAVFTNAMQRLRTETKPVCRVVYDRGKSQFDIGGKIFETTFYNLTEDWNDLNDRLHRQVAHFRDAGVHLYGLGVDTRKVWLPDGSIDFAKLIVPMASALSIDPEARFMFCISTYMPPKWWVAANPDELTGYANGTVNPHEDQCLKNVAVPSIASMKWRKDVADYQTRLVKYLESTPYAARIFAYRTDFGINHEWHSYGMRDNLMPDNGKAMTAAFRDWLRAEYKGDVAALQKAWRDAGVTFENACTPPPALRTRASAGLLRDPVLDRAVVDYERCHGAMLRECLFASNRAIKEACGGRALVGNYCGYFFGLPEVAEGCHIENDAILDSPLVDFQSSPLVYGPDARMLGAPQYARCLLEGLRRRGKVALMEADNAPSASGDTYCDYSKNFIEDEAILARDFAQTLCWGCGFWYFDFGRGWYANERYGEFFKKIYPIRSRRADCTSASEVLVVGDYESIIFSNIKLPTDLHNRCVTAQVTELGFAGVPFDSASMADLASGKLKEYKLYIFPNLFYVTPEKEKLVNALRAAGKVVLIPEVQQVFSPKMDKAQCVKSEPHAPIRRAELRKLLAAAGVHIYNADSASSLYANAGYVALHSATKGPQSIRLPRSAKVEMLYPEKRDFGKCAEFTFELPAPYTVIFAYE